jgi:hypothetical protein
MAEPTPKLSRTRPRSYSPTEEETTRHIGQLGRLVWNTMAQYREENFSDMHKGAELAIARATLEILVAIHLAEMVDDDTDGELDAKSFLSNFVQDTLDRYVDGGLKTIATAHQFIPETRTIH